MSSASLNKTFLPSFFAQEYNMVLFETPLKCHKSSSIVSLLSPVKISQLASPFPGANWVGLKFVPQQSSCCTQYIMHAVCVYIDVLVTELANTRAFASSFPNKTDLEIAAKKDNNK